MQAYAQVTHISFPYTFAHTIPLQIMLAHDLPRAIGSGMKMTVYAGIDHI